MPKQHINSIVSDLFFNHQHPHWDDAIASEADAEEQERALLTDAREFITDYDAIIPLLQGTDLSGYADALVADFQKRL